MGDESISIFYSIIPELYKCIESKSNLNDINDSIYKLCINGLKNDSILYFIYNLDYLMNVLNIYLKYHFHYIIF